MVIREGLVGTEGYLWFPGCDACANMTHIDDFAGCLWPDPGQKVREKALVSCKLRYVTMQTQVGLFEMNTPCKHEMC